MNRPLTVLLAEDSRVQRLQISGLLESQGFDVRAANDGADALRMLRSPAALPDLVLADIGMPKVNGINLCREIKSNLATKHIPVVILTGLANERNHQTALEAGADEFLVKPVSETELIVRIQSVLGLARETLRRELRRLREIYNAMPDAVLVSDESDRYIEVNRAASLLLGYSRDQFLRLTGRTLSLNEDTWFESRQRLQALGTWSGRDRLRRRNSSAVSVTVRAVRAVICGERADIWIMHEQGIRDLPGGQSDTEPRRRNRHEFVS